MTNPSPYQRVTDRIVAMLEAGTKPWAPPWQAGAIPTGSVRPRRHDGTPYRGANTLNLWAACLERNFTSPYWLTFNRAREIGGMVRKGEKADCAFYVGKIVRAAETPDGPDKQIAFLKAYPVFNADQIDGLPPGYYAQLAAPVILAAGQRMAAVDEWIAGTGAAITHGGARSFYSPSQDAIRLPEFAAFPEPADYYGTALHEIMHWTGAPNRLDRTKGAFGNSDCAAEELVAELGAAYLCADLGVAAEPREDHAQYIAHYLKQMRDDPRAIFKAAGHAERAAGFAHALQPAMPVALPLAA